MGEGEIPVTVVYEYRTGTEPPPPPKPDSIDLPFRPDVVMPPNILPPFSAPPPPPYHPPLNLFSPPPPYQPPLNMFPPNTFHTSFAQPPEWMTRPSSIQLPAMPPPPMLLATSNLGGPPSAGGLPSPPNKQSSGWDKFKAGVQATISVLRIAAYGSSPPHPMLDFSRVLEVGPARQSFLAHKFGAPFKEPTDPADKEEWKRGANWAAAVSLAEMATGGMRGGPPQLRPALVSGTGPIAAAARPLVVSAAPVLNASKKDDEKRSSDDNRERGGRGRQQRGADVVENEDSLREHQGKIRRNALTDDEPPEPGQNESKKPRPIIDLIDKSKQNTRTRLNLLRGSGKGMREASEEFDIVPVDKKQLQSSIQKIETRIAELESAASNQSLSDKALAENSRQLAALVNRLANITKGVP